MSRAQLTANDIRRAARKLKAADEKRRCHLCNQKKPDAFSWQMVSIHMRCGEKQMQEIADALSSRNARRARVR